MENQSVPRIMIVESYANNVKSLTRHLAELALAHELLTTIDAETALERLRTEPVDLLIIDTCLRGQMDGFDLCRAFRKLNPERHTPIILLLTGYLSLERSKGIIAGADLLLLRPVVKEELLKMIELLLGYKTKQPVPSKLAVRNP